MVCVYEYRLLPRICCAENVVVAKKNKPMTTDKTVVEIIVLKCGEGGSAEQKSKVAHNMGPYVKELNR